MLWALKGSMTKWGDLLYELTKAGAQDISGTPETYEQGRIKILNNFFLVRVRMLLLIPAPLHKINFN